MWKYKVTLILKFYWVKTELQYNFKYTNGINVELQKQTNDLIICWRGDIENEALLENFS